MFWKTQNSFLKKTKIAQNDTQQGKGISQTLKYTVEMLKARNTCHYISQQLYEQDYFKFP